MMNLKTEVIHHQGTKEIERLDGYGENKCL